MVTVKDGWLSLISVADPAHPVELGHGLLGHDMVGVYTRGDYAYVSDQAYGLRVISVADPANPSEVGYCHTCSTANQVVVRDSYAYVTQLDSISAFTVASVSDPVHPEEVGHLRASGYGGGVAVSGDYACFVVQSGGLRVISVADPENPVEVGAYHFPGMDWPDDVVLNASYAYVVGRYIGGLRVISIADPAHPVEVGYCAAPGGAVSVAVNGDYAYVVDIDSGGLRVVSIADPEHPTEVGYYDSFGSAWDVAADDRYIYVAGKTELAVLQLYGFGDLDVDPDSLDVKADTIRLRVPETGDRIPGSPDRAVGAFVLANTSASYNPDPSDGPSSSPVDSLRFTASFAGAGGTLDSIRIFNLPESLAQGQTVVCTLALHVPDSLPNGSYSGSITITGVDLLHNTVVATVYALVQKHGGGGTLGDLDVDPDSLGVVHDTMNLHTQPAGPVYSPYAKAEFMLVNTSSAYNPDTADGPSRSPLRKVKVEAKVKGQKGSMDSVYVLNLPESLAIGQAVECTLALVVPVGESLDSHTGWVVFSAKDTLGFSVQDSFFLAVRGPQPRQNLDSLRVAPIPFKPNQNPEHDAIHFQGLTAGARVTVYDASGQSVWSATENGDGHLKWDAKVASGIYVYLVVAKDGQSKIGKLSVIR